jgi:hypothetical protein
MLLESMRSLAVKCSVRALVIRNCSLGNDGLVAIAEAFKRGGLPLERWVSVFVFVLVLSFTVSLNEETRRANTVAFFFVGAVRLSQHLKHKISIFMPQAGDRGWQRSCRRGQKIEGESWNRISFPSDIYIPIYIYISFFPFQCVRTCILSRASECCVFIFLFFSFVSLTF